ncbi:MAG: hypothetical protein ACK559_16995, partial [bacterium]
QIYSVENRVIFGNGASLVEEKEIGPTAFIDLVLVQAHYVISRQLVLGGFESDVQRKGQHWFDS